LEKIISLPIFPDVEYKNNAPIEYIPDEFIDKFFIATKAQSIHCNTLRNSNLKVVFTPLNGTGNKPIRRILKEIGIEDLVIVKEQELPDGNFTTCPFPNPEIKEALSVGLEYCKREKPDLLLATDPDCDRVGIAVPSDNGYVLFDGNTVGALLTDYLLSERSELGNLPQKPVVVKTIVSTDIIFDIGKKYNADVKECLTGFKYIGQIIRELEEKGEENRFIFGFEESYGYLAGTHGRDKDAVVASMLICEMAAFYKAKGISMIQARENLYTKYGYYTTVSESFYFEGESGMHIMQNIMSKLRTEKIDKIDNVTVSEYIDYKNDNTGLPKSDVLSYKLENGTKVIIRPSGTEPKLKTYCFAKCSSTESSLAMCNELLIAVKKILGV
jgi:phosphoglucomutase